MIKATYFNLVTSDYRVSPNGKYEGLKMIYLVGKKPTGFTIDDCRFTADDPRSREIGINYSIRGHVLDIRSIEKSFMILSSPEIVYTIHVPAFTMYELSAFHPVFVKECSDSWPKDHATRFFLSHLPIHFPLFTLTP